MQTVHFFKADGCHLCQQALEIVEAVRAEVPFELVIVDIGGDPGLERSYRERLPVVEIDGEPVFTYFVTAAALRARVA